MTLVAIPSNLSNEEFGENFAGDCWGECLAVLKSYDINLMRSLARIPGYPGVMYNLDPAAADWPLLCAARHARLQSLEAVIAGYLTACAVKIQQAIDNGESLLVQRQYMMFAISELRFHNRLTAPWLDVFGRIIGEFDQTDEELDYLVARYERRRQLLHDCAPMQDNAYLHILGILRAQDYCVSYDDHRAIVALAAMSVACQTLAPDSPRRQKYRLEALDAIGTAMRPRHVAWLKIRAEVL